MHMNIYRKSKYAYLYMKNKIYEIYTHMIYTQQIKMSHASPLFWLSYWKHSLLH